MTRFQPPAHGSYVQLDNHPEYGIGCVVAAGAFATRVLFVRGGVRVFRSRDMHRLLRALPTAADTQLLSDLALAFKQDMHDPALWPAGAENDDRAKQGE